MFEKMKTRKKFKNRLKELQTRQRVGEVEQIDELRKGKPAPYAKRTLWYKKRIVDEYNDFKIRIDLIHEGFAGKHNLIGSLCESGLHAPLFDFDVPCELLPSKTPGHYHFYIDKEITREQYEKILDAFVDAGIVEPGWKMQLEVYNTTLLRTREQVLKEMFGGEHSDEERKFLEGEWKGTAIHIDR